MAKQLRHVTADQARANAAAVRALWQAGRDSLERLPEDSPALSYRRCAATFDKEARRLGINLDWVGKGRRIAEQYTHRDINDLCRLIVEHRSTFSATHLIVGIRIQDRKQRDSIVRRAIKESWSVSRLKHAAQAQRGERRESVGRKPHVPDDLAQQLVILDANGERFSRFAATVHDGLPKDLRVLIESAMRALGRVQRVAKQHLADLGDKR